ncbi:hypothetical protein BUALT_Bualt05G0150100 [Buddleja alternifolia]|uniref:Uncharacterized protein n=1 Tax=Buddleja alternifolia TaxID=168488 RepID=A0AAV6XS20_9LAMI|nr:hypothetical protein BUALT_Bualt05G0150100 [Buddleja alternifolia]
MKNKVNNSSNNGELPKLKERHIVSWSQEEDDILREQIHVHGTDNWAIIASKFKDKTTRQCRRRWFTYLNSDFKKGGWSPEEDMLLSSEGLCRHRRYLETDGLRLQRTDNAVKNRFTTLCKKRAKREALAKENSTTSYINLNNKRVIFRNGLNADGGSESVKKIRTYITESCNQGEQLADENNKTQRTFLKKDDPKMLALMQQAELLSSLAIKVNTEKTEQSLETAWMVLQDFLKQNKESDHLDANCQFEKLQELMEDLRPSWREHKMYDSSPASSEYSTGSTLLCNAPVDKTEECEAEICVLNQKTSHELQKNQDCVAEENGMNEVKNICEYSDTEFGSPLHVTPLFGALAAAIPSPEFSESEKHFLMKTLGMESASASPITNPPQPPPCKRSLLHCL